MSRRCACASCLFRASSTDAAISGAQVPLDYATEVCNLFAQLGARGSSIMFSSGDDGVGAGNCLTNDGKNTKRFQPNFPASCPFVTTVRLQLAQKIREAP